MKEILLEQPTSPVIEADRDFAQPAEPFEPLSFSPARDEEILTYLRRSRRFAEIATLAEQDTFVMSTCEQLGITVSEEELQAAGDTFRMEHKLLGSAATLAWLSQQRISVENWSEGIRVELLTRKLQEHLLGEVVDGSYMGDRDNYRRVALSQILVSELAIAHKIVKSLREENSSFCALALEHSRGKQSQENGGFVGVRFFVELMPEIAQAVANAAEGEIIGPLETRLGYHVLRVEKQFATELSESVREQVLDALFQNWLQELKNRNE